MQSRVTTFMALAEHVKRMAKWLKSMSGGVKGQSGDDNAVRSILFELAGPLGSRT